MNILNWKVSQCRVDLWKIKKKIPLYSEGHLSLHEPRTRDWGIFVLSWHLPSSSRPLENTLDQQSFDTNLFSYFLINMYSLPRRPDRRLRSARRPWTWGRPPGLTFPQSLWLSVVAEGILAFFLLALSFSPAFTTSLVSFLQVGQYLAEWKGINHFWKGVWVWWRRLIVIIISWRCWSLTSTIHWLIFGSDTLKGQMSRFF